VPGRATTVWSPTWPAPRSSNGNPARRSWRSNDARDHPRDHHPGGLRRHRRRRIDQLRPLVTGIANLNLIALLAWKVPVLKRVQPWRGYVDAQRRLDELLYSEIANRRSDPNAAERSDRLSRLLHPEDDGGTLTDAELRDQLVTFLLAGHETTATTLAWTLHELAHRPELQREAQAAADRGDAEGDAPLEVIVKEAMRLRPVIFQATRALTRPMEIAGYLLPAGVVVSPTLGLSTRLTTRRRTTSTRDASSARPLPPTCVSPSVAGHVGASAPPSR
jgi:cytochrome P450